MSVIVALESLKRSGEQVLIYSDSKYVVDAVEKGWLFEWERKGFRGKKNADLWERFLEIYPKHHVRFKWIKGHNNHIENERCDELAVAAAMSGHLHADKGFESGEFN